MMIPLSQLFKRIYSTDPLDPRRSVVLTHKRTKLESDDFCDNIEDTPSFSKGVPTLEMKEELEDYLFMHNDCDGKYVALHDHDKEKRKQNNKFMYY